MIQPTTTSIRTQHYFGGLGIMSGGDYGIHLREDAVQFALTVQRRVSIPLMDAVKRELQSME